MEKKMSLNEQAKEIIKIAEEKGVQSNFFFVTTFKRYQVQLNILQMYQQASILVTTLSLEKLFLLKLVIQLQKLLLNFNQTKVKYHLKVVS